MLPKNCVKYQSFVVINLFLSLMLPEADGQKKAVGKICRGEKRLYPTLASSGPRAKLPAIPMSTTWELCKNPTLTHLPTYHRLVSSGQTWEQRNNTRLDTPCPEELLISLSSWVSCLRIMQGPTRRFVAQVSHP